MVNDRFDNFDLIESPAKGATINDERLINKTT